MNTEELLREAFNGDDEPSLSPTAVRRRAQIMRRRHRVVAASAAATVAAVGSLIVTSAHPFGIRAATLPPTAAADAAPTTSTTATAEQNRALAQVEAQRILGLARVPPGAVLEKNPPGINSTFRASLGIVVSEKYWDNPLSLGDTYNWLLAHPTMGAPQPPQTLEPSTKDRTLGFYASLTATDAWDSGAGEMSIRKLTDGTTQMMARGRVNFLDPAPWLDTLAGPRLRLTKDSTCPGYSNLKGIVGVDNPGADDLATRVLPTEAPTGAFLCSYLGVSSSGQPISSSKVLDTATAVAAANTLRRAHLSHYDGPLPLSGIWHIPAAVIAFTYADREPVDIMLTNNTRYGATSVANGHVIGTISMSEVSWLIEKMLQSRTP